MGTVVGRTQPTTVYGAVEGEKFNAQTTLVCVRCYTCGILYAIPEGLDSSAQLHHGDSANGWWISCPLGHTWGYTGETDLEKAKRQLRAERARAGRLAAGLDQTAASRNALKGVVTKQRKKLDRVKNGVCPCCNRSFVNLQRHMSTKHPEWLDRPAEDRTR